MGSWSGSTIGSLHKGNNATYQFDDNAPLSNLGYYRLKMMDNDGQFKYSKAISIERGKGLSVSVFPNPVKNELTIALDFESQKGQIEVFDVLGRSVFQQNTEGGNLLTINTLNWSKGIYFLKIGDGQKIFQQKIIKQ